MFKITDGKGFHITFKNGVTVSVQFGYGNYDAEIAIWNKQGKWITRDIVGHDDNVKAHVSPDELLSYLEKAKIYNGNGGNSCNY